MAGWIKIHRTILEKGWSNKPDFIALWVYLLLQASHESREYFWNGKTIFLRPGQFISGRLKMATNTGIQESKVERILKCFESEQQIEQQKTSTSRLISIINWTKFQESEQQSEQQMNNKRTTDEQPVNTKQELKKVKKVKNERSVFIAPTEIEVENYILEGQVQVELHKIKDLAGSFFDHFTSNGWLVGKAKAPMQDWKASVRNWIRNDKKYSKQINGNQNSNSSAADKTGGIPNSRIRNTFNQPKIPVD